jgi:SAM-dependent methyltransferase
VTRPLSQPPDPAARSSGLAAPAPPDRARSEQGGAAAHLGGGYRITPDDPGQPPTASPAYAERLRALEGQAWKRWLHVQAPYRWNLRRLRPGFTLDVGCGIGRNLDHLDGHGVGIDHNAAAVAQARARGFEAYVPAEFEASPYAMPGRFDSLLVAHVLEHMTEPEAVALVEAHLRYVRPGGQVILITPQEAGQRSDPTHVTLLDAGAMRRLAAAAGVVAVRTSSFPLPRPAGRVFVHNETVTVGRTPG